MAGIDQIFPPDGYYAKAMSGMGMTDEPAFLEYVLRTPFRLNDPFDPNRTTVSLPPRVIGGSAYGPAPSDVLIVAKHPSREDINSGQLMNMLGNPLFKEMARRGVDARTWVVAAAVNFGIDETGTIKAPQLKECQALLSETVRRVSPKFLLILGKEALDQVARVYGLPKQKFTEVKGVPLRLADGVVGVVGYPHSVTIKMPALTGEWHRALDMFASLVAPQFPMTGELPEQMVEQVTEASNLITEVPYREVRTVDGLTQELTRFSEFYAAMGNKCLVSVDVEWGRAYRLVTVQFCYSKDDVVVFNLRAGGRDTELGSVEEWACSMIARVFARPNVIVAGHNVRQDVEVLKNRGVDLTDNFINGGLDTLVGYHMIPGNEAKLEKDLLAVGMELVGIGRYDAALNLWKSQNAASIKSDAYMHVPEQVLVPYAAMDAWVGYMVCGPIVNQLVAAQVWELYVKHEHPLNRCLLEMEGLGVPLDEERLAVLSDLCVIKVEELDKELQKACNWLPTSVEEPVAYYKNGKEKPRKFKVDPGFNPASVLNVREVLYGHYKRDKTGTPIKASPPESVCFNLTPIKSTNDVPWDRVVRDRRQDIDAPSTDGESLAILAEQCPFAQTLAERSQVEQLRKTFTGTYERDAMGGYVWSGGLGAHTRRGVTYTRYRTTLKTGRFATSPNHQNLPKRREPDLVRIFSSDGTPDPRYKSLRSAIMAEPGHVLIEADWNQAELWTMGGLAGDDEFLHTLAVSDVHTETMIKMFPTYVFQGKTLLEWGAKAINDLRKKHPELDQLRSIAKTVVFGVPYGRGRAAIAREVQKSGGSCTVEEAGKFLSSFADAAPKITDWINGMKRLALDPGIVSNPYGRKRRFFPTQDRSIQAAQQREAVNFPIQSTVGDAMREAMNNLFNYRIETGIHNMYTMRLSVHDAVVLMVPGIYVEQVLDVALPLCMTERVVIPGMPFKLTLGTPDVAVRWGEHPTEEQLVAANVPRSVVDRLVNQKKKK
jgi:DNA polymerase I-like protein with 3'-5' exonuclease and polymerase domains/uracil-DNA glycosylase